MGAGESLRRRDAGARTLASGPNRGLYARVLGAILRRKPGVSFTSDDLRRTLRVDSCPNAWGTAFHNAAKAGHIVADGFRRSVRPGSHARIVVIWRRA